MTQVNGCSSKLYVSGMCLSHSMVVALLEHRGGLRLIRIENRDTLKALRARGLVYFNRNARPTCSRLTKKGREVLQTIITSGAQSDQNGDVTFRTSHKTIYLEKISPT